MHGTISTESILFFENGDILLKDWIFKSSRRNLYGQEVAELQKGDDLKALGKILAQSACLRGPDEI